MQEEEYSKTSSAPRLMEQKRELSSRISFPKSSGDLWKEALNDPATMVDWIIVRPGLKLIPL